MTRTSYEGMDGGEATMNDAGCDMMHKMDI